MQYNLSESEKHSYSSLHALAYQHGNICAFIIGYTVIYWCQDVGANKSFRFCFDSEISFYLSGIYNTSGLTCAPDIIAGHRDVGIKSKSCYDLRWILDSSNTRMPQIVKLYSTSVTRCNCL